MKFDEVFNKISYELFEKFEGLRSAKGFPSDEERFKKTPYYGKGGKNLKSSDNTEEITRQQIEVYKKVFDELSKKPTFSYEDLMNVAKQKFMGEGQNSTTAVYNAKRFANVMMDHLSDVEDTSDKKADSNGESKFDSIADEIDNKVSGNSAEEGYYEIVVKDVETLKNKMVNLFKREGFERTDAYGVVNTIMSEPARYFNYDKLISRLEEQGEMTGSMSESRVRDIIKKLIRDNVISSSEKGSEPSEDEGVPALEPADDVKDFSNPNTGKHEAERLTSMSGQGFYKKPGFGGHNPFRDKELD